MVMIARDEAENIARCFDSFWPHVDEVVLVDTGSKDTTIRTAKTYAYDRGEADKLVIGTFEWTDDFAEARNYADSLASGEWVTWTDLDDTIVGFDELRKTIDDAGPDINGIYTQYDYVTDKNGIVHCELVRERAVRAGAAEWFGRVHECKVVMGQCIKLAENVCKWVHHGVGDEKGRNLRILHAWQEHEPDNARVASYLGTELLVSGDFQGALAQFEHYMSLPGQPIDNRAQAYRRMCGCLLALGQVEAAQKLAVIALTEHPGWPDTYLTLAEIANENHNWPQTLEFANDVIRRGKPETVLIVNPTDYTARPRMLIAQAFANLGRYDEAVQAVEQVIEICPGFMDAEEHAAHWRGQRHREQVAGTWAANARLLCDFDEPEKARELLSTVPYYCTDHPQIIAAKLYVEDALKTPYKVVPIEPETPRGNFLMRQLEAQQAELPDDTFRVFDPAGAATEWLERSWPRWTVHTVSDDDLYDAVIVTADLDNWLDPEERLDVLVKHVVQGGRLYVTVPVGRIGSGPTPGRRRAWRDVDVAAMLRARGEMEVYGIDPEGWINGAITPRPKRDEIAIWTGYAIGPWHPMDIAQVGLGGSETAAWRLAERLAELDYTVTLYGHFATEGCVKDVILRDFKTFDPSHPYKAVVAFRDAQMFDRKLAAEHTVLWLEDVAGGEGITPERMENIDYVYAVSQWHHDNVIEQYPWIDTEKVVACRNGIHLPFFTDGEQPERELRVLYTSSPDRGLDILLEVWPRVAEQVPGVKLQHAYSRWYDLVADAAPGISTHRQRLRGLEEAAGSERLPSQGQKALAQLMRSSRVWVAPSYFSPAKAKFNETSCISAMEAQAAGLAVVASNWGALAETVKVGAKLDGDPVSDEYKDKLVSAIVSALTSDTIAAGAQELGPVAMADMGWDGAVDQLMLAWGHRPGTLTLRSTG